MDRQRTTARAVAVCGDGARTGRTRTRFRMRRHGPGNRGHLDSPLAACLSTPIRSESRRALSGCPSTEGRSKRKRSCTGLAYEQPSDTMSLPSGSSAASASASSARSRSSAVHGSRPPPPTRLARRRRPRKRSLGALTLMHLAGPDRGEWQGTVDRTAGSGAPRC
jgi:hypothetical protein